MADLDVDDLLSDPDFTNEIKIMRFASDVSNEGEGLVEPISEHVVDAVVIPNSGQQLMVLDDGSRISDSITIYCKLQLRAGTEKRDADEVRWDHNRYRVKISKKYAFGEGFYQAICEFLGEEEQ